MSGHTLPPTIKWLVVRQVELKKAINEAFIEKTSNKTAESINRYKLLVARLESVQDVWRQHPGYFELDLEWLASENGSKKHKFAKDRLHIKDVRDLLSAMPSCWLLETEIWRKLTDLNIHRFSQYSEHVQKRIVVRALHRLLVHHAVRRRKSTRCFNEYEWQAIT